MLSLLQSTLRSCSLSGKTPACSLLLAPGNRCPQLDQTAGLKRTLESRIGLPERPKKPLSPYFRFMTEVRSSVKAAHPHLSLLDVVKAIGVKWESVDADKKAAYQADYKREQIEFLKKRAAYEASLTDGQRLALESYKQEQADRKTKQAERKRVRDLARPRRTSSPYLFWLAEGRERKTLQRLAGEPFRDWQKRMAAEWQKLSDEAKRPYMDRARVAFSRYNDELLAWEEKMVRQGNVDLVRNNMLLEPLDRKLRSAKKTPKSPKKDDGPASE